MSLILLRAVDPGRSQGQEADSKLRDEALRTLKKAATFYRDKVASHGGYVYYYSARPQGALGRGQGVRRHDLRAAARERPPSAWPTSRPTPRRATSSTSTPPAKPPRPWSTGNCSPAAGRRSSTSAPAKRHGQVPQRQGRQLERLLARRRPDPGGPADAHPRRPGAGLQARRDPRGRPVRARRPAQGAVPQRGLPAGVDRARGGEAGRQGQVPGLRLEDRRQGQELLGLLHPQRQPGGDRRRHADRRAPGLQGRRSTRPRWRSSATS